MDRLSTNYFFELRTGMREYVASDVQQFLANKDTVSHGRNGITVSLEGGYRVALDNEIIMNTRVLDFEEYSLEIGYIPSINPEGILERSLFSKGVKLSVICAHPFLRQNIEALYKNNGELDVRNPLLLYSKRLGDQAILVKGMREPPKRRRRVRQNLKDILKSPVPITGTA
jgi:hypothetical protein